MTEYWPIMACALRDELVKAAKYGDADALRLLVSSVPKAIPARVRCAWRDGQIRGIAISLRSVMPGAADFRIARILATAGAQLRSRASLHGPLFDELTTDECQDVVGAIRYVLDRLGDGDDRVHWPSLGQMRNVLGC